MLDRLDLRGDETVLDAGCGSGRVTRLLAERLPRGRVIAVDASPQMVARAREELGRRAPTCARPTSPTLRLADGEQVDAAFSNAVFHWVPDHDALFARAGGGAAARRPPSARSAAARATSPRCTSRRCAAAADAGLADRFAGWARPVELRDARGDRARACSAAGFVDVRCWLQTWPVEPDEPRAYLQTVCLGPHLERLEADEHERFLDAVMARLGERPVLDYVRLNIVARRALTPTLRRLRGLPRALRPADGRARQARHAGRRPARPRRRARPTSRNAPPTAIPKSEICSAM